MLTVFLVSVRTGQCQNTEKRTHGNSSKGRVSLRRQEDDERTEGRNDSVGLSLSASVLWLSGISTKTLFTYVNTRLSPSFLLSSSRVCPLVLLAWCLMEPVPHTGPLRDYARANHRSCDSSISHCSWHWHEGLCPCWEPAAKVADWAAEVKGRQVWGVLEISVLPWYVISKAKGKIVNNHSNGFTGLHLLLIHVKTHTFFTHMYFAWGYIYTCNHSKGYLNWKEFVPWGQFVGLKEEKAY